MMPPVRMMVCPLDDREAERDFVHALRALVHHNERIYRAGRARAPWDIDWVPDGPAGCVVVSDAVALQRRGAASCGELAAAYTGYLRAQGDSQARVHIERTGPRQWHAVCIAGDSRVYDPAIIGGDHDGL